MTAPRIKPIDPPYTPEIEADFDKLMRGQPPLLLFRTVAKNPRVLQRMIAGGLLDRGSISIRTRELMILRTTAKCGAEYEWGVHIAAFGSKAAWTQEQIYSSVHDRAEAPCWNKEEQLVIRLADQLHGSAKVDEALWGDLSSHFEEGQMVELVMLAGLYHAVSFMVNVTGVQHEKFAPHFPIRVAD
jgi:alkylhydroperoxidase family enzyme